MSGRGRHAAADGSFQRSAGKAMARGIVLILAAVLLGVILLKSTDPTDPFTEKAAAGDATRTTVSAPDTSDTTATTTPAKAHAASEVTVLVANGSGVKGAAGRVAESLKTSNYVLKQSVNTTAPAEASFVYYAEGYEADARAIAGLLTPPPGIQAMPTPLPVKDLGGAKILVVVANDLAAGR